MDGLGGRPLETCEKTSLASDELSAEGLTIEKGEEEWEARGGGEFLTGGWIKFLQDWEAFPARVSYGAGLKNPPETFNHQSFFERGVCLPLLLEKDPGMRQPQGEKGGERL